MRAKLPTTKKLMYSMFFFLIALLPTILFLDAGIKLSQIGVAHLLLKTFQTGLTQPPDPLVSWLSGSFWRLIIAYLLIGVLLNTKAQSVKKAYRKGMKVAGINLIMGATTCLLSLVLLEFSSSTTFLRPFASLLETYSAAYFATLFCIWGRLQEPFITFLAQLLIAPAFSALGWWMMMKTSTKIRGRGNVFANIDLSNPYIRQRVTPPSSLLQLSEGSTQTFKTQKPIVIDDEDKLKEYIV